jgi:predicted alpha-1,6-mannanase (GH76 family)
VVVAAPAARLIAVNRTIAVAAAFAAALAVLAPGIGASDRAPSNLARATLAFATLQQHFHPPGAVYHDTYPGKGASSAWSFSQALAATIDLARVDPSYRPALRAELGVLRSYDDGDGYTPYPGRGSLYVDDNEWIGQDLVAASTLLGDRSSLARAERLFTLVRTAWDADTHDACAGGVFWTRDPSNTDRNTVSTANGALLALALYGKTGDRSYLDWARTMYAWVNRCLTEKDGLYADHLTPTGVVNTREWSYNQGAMIAAGTALYTATYDRAYLRQATSVASTALARYARTNFAGEPTYFVAIFFRDLAQLDRVAPNAAHAVAAQRYADAQWATARDQRTTLLDQSAIVDLYAELARSTR